MSYISALAHIVLGPEAMSGRPVEHARAIVLKVDGFVLSTHSLLTWFLMRSQLLHVK